jgi:hypothetical protein
VSLLELLLGAPASPRRRRATTGALGGHERPRDNPEDQALFAAARALARRIHGDGHGTVVELDARERGGIWPRYVAFYGYLRELAYRLPRGSARSGVEWVHATGDRGALRPTARARRILVADPRTRKVGVVDAGAPLRVDDDGMLVN